MMSCTFPKAADVLQPVDSGVRWTTTSRSNSSGMPAGPSTAGIGVVSPGGLTLSVVVLLPVAILCMVYCGRLDPTGELQLANIFILAVTLRPARGTESFFAATAPLIDTLARVRLRIDPRAIRPRTSA